MDLEIIEDYKKELFENISSELQEEGKISTFVQVVGEKDGIDKPVIVHIVTGFSSNEEKDFFINDAVPDICKRLKQNKINPKLVVFVSECWMTKIDSKTNEEEKGEIVLVTISSDKGDELSVYNIVRHPYEINDKGDLVSKTELVKDDDITTTDKEAETQGRFTNLYARFMKHLNND